MTDKERILEYLRYKGISKNKFYIKTGLSVGFLDSGKSLGVDKLRMVLDNYHDLNPMWMITGQGEMLVKNELANQVNEPQSVYQLRTDTLEDDQRIPLFDIEAAAGTIPMFDNLGIDRTEEYIQIPKAPKCDGAIYVTGDSMYPLLKSGDMVAYKLINDYTSEIFWGNMYILSINVAGDNLRLVKYVHKSEIGNDYIKLVSENRHHQDKDIRIQDIQAMAMVKAMVRLV